MTASLLADWVTPRPFSLPDLGPGLEDLWRERLEDALRQMSEDPYVKALVLFGSRARGTARCDSDLDLLVVERTPSLEGATKVESWNRHFQPLRSLPLAIDLVVCGSADAQHLAGSRWHVVSEAARNGQVLVVKP